jgi:hypothetical protein
MYKILLLAIVSLFFVSCGSNDASSEKKETENTSEKKETENTSEKKGTEKTTDIKTTEMKNKTGNKFGEWEQDSEGNKYREDHELKQSLSGYELVKYTRINGGQFGGGSSTTKFTLCSDGSSRYYHQSLTTVSVEGAGGSDSSQDEDYGTWKAIENEKGLKLLLVKSTKHNTTGFMEIRPGDSKVQLVWFNEWQEFLKKKIDC